MDKANEFQRDVYNILIVDDQEVFRKGYTEILKHPVYDIDTATTANEGKQNLLKKTYHLILIDKRMKNFNDEMDSDAGIELARYVTKEYPYTSRVILTATTDIEPVKIALRENIVDDYFNKDDIGDLNKRVSTWLDERKLKFRTVIGDLYLVDPLDFYGKKCRVSSNINNEGGVVELGPGCWRARLFKPIRETHYNKGEEVIVKAINIDHKDKEITSLRVGAASISHYDY